MPEIGRRGRKPSPEKRAAIIAAAVRSFAARGVDASTTREIAEAAETTERTLFKHFGSKDGLVSAVLETASLEFFREQSFARIADATPFTRSSFANWYQRFLQDRVEGAIRSPDLYRVIFRELFRDDGFRQRYVKHWLGAVFLPLAEHLTLLQDAGEIGKQQTPVALAGAFYSMNIGYLLSRFALAPDIEWDDQAATEAIVSMFLAACGQP